MKSLRDEIRLRREIRTDLISSAKQISSERSEDFIAPRAISLKRLQIGGTIGVNEAIFSRESVGAFCNLFCLPDKWCFFSMISVPVGTGDISSI